MNSLISKQLVIHKNFRNIYVVNFNHIRKFLLKYAHRKRIEEDERFGGKWGTTECYQMNYSLDL